MTVTVNGNVIEVPDGTSISVQDGKVVVGGSTRFTYREEVKVEVNGPCGSVSTMSGDVRVTGDVAGYVKTMSGDVTCGKVSGGVSTMSGDITHGG